MALASGEQAPCAPTAGPPPAPAARPATLRARTPTPTPAGHRAHRKRGVWRGGGRGAETQIPKTGGTWPGQVLAVAYDGSTRATADALPGSFLRRTAGEPLLHGGHQRPLPGGPDDLRAFAQAWSVGFSPSLPPPGSARRHVLCGSLPARPSGPAPALGLGKPGARPPHVCPGDARRPGLCALQPRAQDGRRSVRGRGAPCGAEARGAPPQPARGARPGARTPDARPGGRAPSSPPRPRRRARPRDRGRSPASREAT